MNEYENNDLHPEQEQPVSPQAREPMQEDMPPQPSEPTAYHGAGAGRRESPYANSPYVMQHQNESGSYRYQPPRQEPSYQYQEASHDAKPKKPKKQRKGLGKKILAAVLAVALVAGSCGITALLVNNHWEARTQTMNATFNKAIADLQQQINNSSIIPIPGNTVASGDLMTPSQVYAANVSSVVAISATIQSNSFYGVSEGTATGSGFILTADGYIITNCHVVEGATSVSVITHDGTKYPATIVGTYKDNDVAVLKVDATDLPAVNVGSSNDLIIGDMVVAIGNPLGELTATQTVGYVSGKDRDVTTDGSIINMIQTDAAINSGNSGGPLFNMYGEVVGITTAKYTGTSGSGATIEGIGFAIPIDDVMGIISDLIDFGYVTGAYMGITVSNTDAESAEMFGLPTGAYVVTVEKGGAADRAGLQPKDIIIDLGGNKVTGMTSLTKALRSYKAGDTTTVTVVRSGSQLELEITLDEKPQAIPSDPTIPQGDGSMPSEGDPNEWFNYYRKFFGSQFGG